jgi:hypothetical protein
MSKKLTLNDIKNENKVYSIKKKITLSGDFHVNIYPNFSPSKITELIKEMVTDKQRAEDAGLNFDDINMGDWVLFNIIYKFADLGIPSDILKKVEAFTILIDSEHFSEIINEFPQESIDKLNKAFARFRENFDFIMKNQGMEQIDSLLEDENTNVQ